VARGQISSFPIDLRRRPYNTLALSCECVMESATVVLCDFDESMFVSSYCSPLHMTYKFTSCVYAGSSMEFQCFEIQIKTEADSNECPYDDKPSTGMFEVSGESDSNECPHDDKPSTGMFAVSGE